MSLISGVCIGLKTVQNRLTDKFYTITDLDNDEKIVQYLHPWIFTEKDIIINDKIVSIYFCYFIYNDVVIRYDIEYITKVLFNSNINNCAYIFGYIYQYNSLLRIILKCNENDEEPILYELSADKTYLHETLDTIIIDGKIARTFKYIRLATSLASHYKL